MKVYYSTDFTGRWPVGASAIVRAENIAEATQLMNEALEQAGLKFDGTLEEFKGKGVVILNDGDY